MSGRRWAPREVVDLRDMLEDGHNYSHIAAKLQRTKGAVRLKVHSLAEGLTRQSAVGGLRRGEVVALLGVGIRTLWNWGQRGYLTPVTKGFGKHIFSHESILEFLGKEEYWHLWEPQPITDPDIRAWAIRKRRGLKFYSTAYVARKANVQHSTIQRHIMLGKCQVVRQMNGHYLIRSDWMKTYLDGQRAALAARKEKAA